MTGITLYTVHSLYGVASQAPSAEIRLQALDFLEGIAAQEGYGSLAAMLDTLGLDIGAFFSSVQSVETSRR
jgi:hypothetical protein